jgi:hypothetical protein
MNDGTDEDFGNDDHGHHEENESCRAIYGQCDFQRGRRRSDSGLEWVAAPKFREGDEGKLCVPEAGNVVRDAIRAAS